MMGTGDLKDLIFDCSEDVFNKQHLLSDDPWYFTRDDAPCDYTTFRNSIGGIFNIPPEQISLIGSGYFGRSLSPSKPFSKYRLEKVGAAQKSDLDVVIISQKHFESIWSDLLEAYYVGHHFAFHRYAKTTFKKFISFDGKINIPDEGTPIPPPTTKFDRVLKIYDAVSSLTSDLQIGNEIKFRVYRNTKDMLDYQNWSLLEFKRAVINQTAKRKAARKKAVK